MRKLYAILTPEAAAKGYPYRKENPLHRLYYHEIAPPEKITYKMRKLGEWLESEEFARAPPDHARGQGALPAAVSTYPWTKNSGKVARLLMNFMLIRHGYLPAVIHSIERQRYYEVLRYRERGPAEPGRRVAGEQHRDDQEVPGRAERPARQARVVSGLRTVARDSGRRSDTGRCQEHGLERSRATAGKKNAPADVPPARWIR